MSSDATCYGCGQKKAQRYGLCRACGHVVGLSRWSTDEAAARMAEGRAAYQARPVKRALLRPRPYRTAIFDGIEFDVVFDGRQYFFCEEWS